MMQPHGQTMANDYYTLLGVAKNADKAAIKKAYRKLAKECHPDKNPGDAAAEKKFKEISEAYAVLSDDEKRAAYDRFGHARFHQQYNAEDIFRDAQARQTFADFGFGGDLFNLFFGGRGGAGGIRFEDLNAGGGNPFGGAFGGGFDPRHAPPRKGGDIEASLTVSFMEAMKGGERTVTLTTPKGKKSVSVTIPAGIEKGKKLRLKGQGNPGPAGPGDLYFVVDVATDPRFEREGADLTVTASVRYSTLALGGAVEAPTLDGPRTLKVPAGADPARKMRIKGAGAPKLSGGGRGDLYVRLAVIAPSGLTPAQEEAARALREAGL